MHCAVPCFWLLKKRTTLPAQVGWTFHCLIQRTILRRLFTTLQRVTTSFIRRLVIWDCPSPKCGRWINTVNTCTTKRSGIIWRKSRQYTIQPAAARGMTKGLYLRFKPGTRLWEKSLVATWLKFVRKGWRRFGLAVDISMWKIQAYLFEIKKPSPLILDSAFKWMSKGK